MGAVMGKYSRRLSHGQGPGAMYSRGACRTSLSRVVVEVCTTRGELHDGKVFLKPSSC